MNDFCQWFQRKRFKNLKKCTKLYHYSMKNRGSTPMLTNLVGVHSRNIHTKFEANPCSGSREEVKNGILYSDI